MARRPGSLAGALFVCITAFFARASAQNDECLKCHDSVRLLLQKKVKHGAVEAGCDACHVNHRKLSATDPKPAAHYLSSSAPELCLTCHDAKDAKIAAAHHGQPFEKAACTDCHNPHASDVPKLLASNPHPPFDARTCDACHKAPAGGKIQLTAASVSQVCFTCHTDMKTLMTTAPAKHSLLEGDIDACVQCHDPHATGRRYMLKQPVNEQCEACHTDVAKKEFVHEAVKTGCPTCHNPHASAHKKNLRAEANVLCLECHAVEGRRKFETDQPVSLFGDQVHLAARPFAEVKLLALRGGTGHPMERHPAIRPAAKDRPEIGCLTCHLPHSAKDSSQLLVTETPTSTALCMRCHK